MASNKTKSDQAATGGSKQAKAGGISSRKKLFYSAVSLWLVAMIVFLACYVKPRVFDKQDTATTGQHEEFTTPDPTADTSGNIEYTDVEYMGTMMPDIFVDIIEAYEKERVSANEVYGTTATVMGKDISVPEYVFRYYSLYITLYQQAYTSINQNGFNNTGYDIAQTPANQTNKATGSTWAITLSDSAIADLQREYVLFHEALAAGTTLTQEEVNSSVNEYMGISSAALASQKTPTEYVENIYTEGVSFSLIKYYIVMGSYITAYQNNLIAEFEKDYTDAKVNAVFDADPASFARSDVRILPIEDLSYDEAEAAKVVDEKTFFEYADKENGVLYTEYDHDEDTKFLAVDSDYITETFGSELSDWIFDSSRKAGEIKMIEGGFYSCLVYIMRPCYYTYSMDYRLLFVPFSGGESASDDDIEEARITAEGYLAQWENGDKTEESFAELCKSYSQLETAAQDGGLFGGARVETVDAHIDEWCLKTGRKGGDVGLVKSVTGYVIIYFIGENRDDPDWKNTYINDSTQADYNAECEKLLAKSGNEISQNQEIIAKALLVCEQLAQRVISNNSN